MDSYFIDPQRRRGAKLIFPAHQLVVCTDSYGIRTQLKFNVVVEKMDLQNLIVSCCGVSFLDGELIYGLILANSLDGECRPVENVCEHHRQRKLRADAR